VFASTTLISRALASAIVSGDKHPLAEDRFVDEAVRRLRAGYTPYTPVREDLTVADAEEQAAVEDAALNDWLDDAEQANPNSPDELSAQP